MPKALRDWDAYNELKRKIDDFLPKKHLRNTGYGEIDQDVDSVILVPSDKNWYTCGYEHVINRLNAPLKVFDMSTIEADIIRLINSVKNVYFIAKFVADLRKISIELASKQTRQNTLNLFSYMRTSK